MKKIAYQTQGTCCRLMNIVVSDDNIIQEVEFIGGCNGNTQGIGMLVKGMKIDDVIERLQGIKCGMKDTSCPDQLAKALKSLMENQ